MVTTTTLADGVGRWNGYAAALVTNHCPVTGQTFTGGTSNHCPDCMTPLHDLSHWKWFSPDEPHPRDVIFND